MAGICEGRLSDSVVLWEELKFDCSSDLSNEIVGVVLKDSIGANSDFDGGSYLSIDSSSRNGGQTKEAIGELHYS
jgi:hypothetical protein